MWSLIISTILFSRCTISIKYQPNPGYGNPPDSLDFAYWTSLKSPLLIAFAALKLSLIRLLGRTVSAVAAGPLSSAAAGLMCHADLLYTDLLLVA